MIASASAMTTTGRRENNQDAYCVDQDLGLFAVADGMGGYAGGEVASNLALDVLQSFLRERVANPRQTRSFRRGASDVDEDRVAQAIRVAHRSILAARNRERPKMGTTIATIVSTGASDLPFVVAHVGDSRVYHWRDGELRQVTRDHSFIEELRRTGAVAPDEDLPSLRNYLTRALGVPGWANPSLRRVTYRPGDRFLLCTDGLSGVLCDEAIAQLMSEPRCEDIAENLVETAYALGSTDNITAVVVEMS